METKHFIVVLIGLSILTYFELISNFTAGVIFVILLSINTLRMIEGHFERIHNELENIKAKLPADRDESKEESKDFYKKVFDINK